MNKLGFSKKLMLLGFINIIALSVVIYSVYIRETQHIHDAQKELGGITLIQPILKTIQSVQRHRGISSGILGGNNVLFDALNEESSLLADRFIILEKTLPTTLRFNQFWREILTEYELIQSSGLSWSKVDNFSAHSHLVSQLQKLINHIADIYTLTLDADISSSYLITTTINDMPTALEQLGQMRAYGTGILTTKTISEKQKIKMYSLIATLINAFDSLSFNLEKTSHYNKEIQTELALATIGIKSSSQKITQIVESDILSKNFVTDPHTFFLLATEVINTGYNQIYETLLPTLEILLYNRIHQIEQKLLISVGSSLLLTLFVQYLFFGIYYATVGNIHLIARSAYKYTHGDLQQRVHLKTKDDIKEIGDSFNEMADSANHLLAIHREDKDRLQAIVNSALDAIIQINTTGIITGWNQQAEVIFGWTKSEAEGQKIEQLIIPEKYRQMHLRGIKSFLISEGRESISSRMEVDALNKNGHEFPVELSISSVNTANGMEFSAFIRDLSDIKEKEVLLSKLSLAVAQSPSSIIITYVNANIEYANQSFLNITGYEIDEIMGKNPKILSSNKTPKTTFDDLWGHLNSGKTWQGELINKRKDGSEYIESALISPIRQANNEVTHYLAIKEDITEKKQAEIELGIAAIAFESQEGIMVTDAENKILRVNKSFTEITGYSIEEVLGKQPTLLNSGRQDSYFYSVMWNKIIQTGSWQGEIWNRHKKGMIYPEWLTITARKDENDKITHYVAIFTDITKFKAAEAKIKHLAYYDPLTQLANRRKLLDHLNHAVSLSIREGTTLALLMLDLDRFKAVNDNLGHLAGDELLQLVAERISKRLRTTDLLARLGGDEFVVLLEDITHPDDAARIAEFIVLELEKPFILGKTNEVHIGVSIGISLFPEHANSVSELIDHADMALYQAKDNGRGCYSFFSENLTDTIRDRLQLESDLRIAIKQQDLRVYYQPQVDILTGAIIGAEALVRWQTKDKGLIPPNLFIPIAEETGLILDIGKWVLQETCRQGQEWLQSGFAPIILAVNVSAHQFKRSNMQNVVQNALASTGFPAEQLELEMTESSLMAQQESIVELLNDLRSLGVLLAIDDFGTGYSSLAYLKCFPLDTLKIDKSFIDDIPHDTDDVEITKAINALGHTLGFKILAEGVENQQQLDFLKKIGCDTYQGYIKSKPLPADEFIALLSMKNTNISL